MRFVPMGLILLIVMTAQEVAAKRVALVIGNTDYQYENKLANPQNDARLLKSVLKNDLNFDEVQLAQNLNIRQFYRAIEQFKQTAQGADIAMIYYSGHGQQGENRQNYLLATDSQIEQFSDLKHSAISADELIEATAGAKSRLVILDACRDRPNSGFKSATKGLSRANVSGQGLLVAYATEAGKVAQDGAAGSNSPYAAALAHAMQLKDKSILAMLDQVTDDVIKATKGQQSPTREGNLRIDVYFVQPTVTVQAPTVTVPSIPVDVENIFWENIKNDTDVTAYQAYLQQYPNGRFVALAQAQIEKYKTQPHPDLVAVRSSSNPLIRSDAELLQQGMWRDPKTRLIWMRCSIGQTWTGQGCEGQAKKYTWQQAQDVLKTMNSQGGFAGYKDWNMPNIEVLSQLRYCSKGFAGTVNIPSTTKSTASIELSCKEPLMSEIQRPTIDLKIFPNTPQQLMYWSIDTNPQYDQGVWGIHFSNGNAYGSYAFSQGYVRAVRKE